MSKIRVLSVDDSALMRQIMREIINCHSDMEMFIWIFSLVVVFVG